jgi:hypothetical protein
MVVMLRNNAQNRPEFKRIEPLLNTLDVRAEAATVRMTMAIASEDLEHIVKPKQAGQRAAR